MSGVLTLRGGSLLAGLGRLDARLVDVCSGPFFKIEDEFYIWGYVHEDAVAREIGQGR